MPKHTRPADLPNFERPPVTEVVLSIQFALMPPLHSIHAALLWQEFRTTHPVVTEHPPINAAFETFGGPAPMQMPMVQIETFLSPPMPRFWFEAPDGSLIQLQQDRILHNWRKLESSQEYPRYEPIRTAFVGEVDRFVAFLDREGFGELRANQTEATYINTIDLPDGSSPHRALERITPLWSGSHSEAPRVDLEGGQINVRYVIHADDVPIGRVHVIFTPAYHTADLKPAMKLEITARGKPRDETVPSAFDMLDRCRDEIVRIFAAVTTPEMHKVWGRTDAR